MPDEATQRELDALRARVERLERAIHAGQGATPPAPQFPAPAAPGQGPVSPPVVQSAVPPAAGTTPATPPSTPPVSRPVEPPAPPSFNTPWQAHLDRTKDAGRGPARKRLTVESIERSIGARWYAAAGAVIVVIALALFLRLAHEQGWLRVTPLVGCSAGGVLGVVLVALGEVARRRLGILAGSGLYAAGLGCSFVSAYASYRLGVIGSAGGAFALMAGVAVAGVLLAARARMVTVAVASLVAGYATPILFASVPPRPLVLPGYLLMLLGVGLGLSVRMGGSFQTLRTLCWLGTVTLGGSWVASAPRAEPEYALLFLALVWAAVHTELVVSARRGFVAPSKRAEPEADPIARYLVGQAELVVRGVVAAGIRPYLSSLCTTAWAVALGLAVVRLGQDPGDWIVPALAAAVTATVAALVSDRVLGALRYPESDADRLAATLFAQAGLLVLLAVTSALTGRAESLTFVFLGSAVLATRWWLGLPAFTAFGLIALSIGTVRVLVIDALLGGFGGSVVWAGIGWSWWTLTVVVAAASWFLAAAAVRPGATVRPGSPGPGGARACVAMGGVALLWAMLNPDSNTSSIVVAWLVLSAGMSAARELDRRVWLDVVGAVGVLAALAAWAVRYGGTSWGTPGSGALLHPGLWLAMLIAASLVASAAWVASNPVMPRRAMRQARAGSAVVAGLLLFVASSHEVARVASLLTRYDPTRGAAVSIWWGMIAVGLIAAGFGLVRRRQRAPDGAPVVDPPPGGSGSGGSARVRPRGTVLRWAGLALLAVAAAKGLLFDIVGVDPLWRIAAVFVIGVMMLGVHLVYTAMMRRSARAAGPVGADPPAPPGS